MIKHSDHGEERDVRMALLKADCDRTGLAYPVELVQYLNQKQDRERQ